MSLEHGCTSSGRAEHVLTAEPSLPDPRNWHFCKSFLDLSESCPLKIIPFLPATAFFVCSVVTFSLPGFQFSCVSWVAVRLYLSLQLDFLPVPESRLLS